MPPSPLTGTVGGTPAPSSPQWQAATGTLPSMNRVHFLGWSLVCVARSAMSTITNLDLAGFFRGSSPLAGLATSATIFQGLSVVAASIELVTTATAFGEKLKKFWAVRKDDATSCREFQFQSTQRIKNAWRDAADKAPGEINPESDNTKATAAYIEAARKQLKCGSARDELLLGGIAFGRDTVLQGGGIACSSVAIAGHFTTVLGPTAAANLPIIGTAISTASGVLHAVQGGRKWHTSATSRDASNTVLCNAKAALVLPASMRSDASADESAEQLHAARLGRKPLASGGGPLSAKQQATMDKRAEALVAARTEGGAACMLNAVNASKALLLRSVSNENGNLRDTARDIHVAKCRIAYGVTATAISAVSLVAMVFTGFLATPVIQALASVAQAAAATWLGYAAFRAHGQLKAASEAARAGDIPDLTREASPESIASETVRILRDRSPENALARNALKATLAELGFRKFNLLLMKYGTYFGASQPDVDTLMVAHITNLISGDGARRALAEIEPETVPRLQPVPEVAQNQKV